MANHEEFLATQFLSKHAENPDHVPSEEEYVALLIVNARAQLYNLMDYVMPEGAPESITPTFDAQDSYIKLRIRRHEKELCEVRLNGNLEALLCKASLRKYISAETLCRCLDELKFKRELVLEFEKEAGVIPPSNFDQFELTVAEQAAEYRQDCILVKRRGKRATMFGNIVAVDFRACLLKCGADKMIEIPFRCLVEGKHERPGLGDEVLVTWCEGTPVTLEIRRRGRFWL